MDSVLVIGGAGYIGSHACTALAGARLCPVTFDNLSVGTRFSLRWGPLGIADLLNAERLREVIRAYRPVAIMHFAASALGSESMSEPSLCYRHNAVGSINLLEAVIYILCLSLGCGWAQR
jgi:UDP-arabinose 4-epimerase